MRDGPRLRVVGYVRVSTDEQASSGVSLAAQRDKIGQFAALHDLDCVGIDEDAGVSGKTLDRPGLRAALARLVPAGVVDGLVVAKLDRLTRNVADLATLLGEQFGDTKPGQLFSVADAIDTRTAAGRLVLNVVMSVAQWERETIVERTREALRHKSSRGERTGRIPLGARLDPLDPRRSRSGQPAALVPDPRPLEAIALGRRMRQSGHTFRRIATELARRGYPAPSGGPDWSIGTLHKFLAGSGSGSGSGSEGPP